MVWPTMIGRIIDGRDQVFTTFFSFSEFRISIFSLRDFSTKGPFFTDLLICSISGFAGRHAPGGWTRSSRQSRSSLDSSLLRLPLRRPFGQEAIGARVVAGLETHSRLAPGRLRLATHGRLRLAAAVGVVTRRHHDAADGRAPTHVALVARAADLLVLVLDVADLTDRRAAADVDDADAARWQADLGVLAFLRDQLRRAAGRAHELRTASRLKLDAVDLRAGRDVLEREAVADAGLGVGSGDDGVADPQVLRRDDVALFAVLIEKECEARGAVRVVLDCLHRGGDPILVALEVHQPVIPLLAAAAVARGHAALRVSAGVAQLALGEASLGLLALGQLVERGGLAEAPHRPGRLVLLQRHFLDPFHQVLLDALALTERDDCLLPIGPMPDAPTEPARFAGHVDHVHGDDVDLERIRDRVGDVTLRRALRDGERVPSRVRLAHRALGDDRSDEDRVAFDAHSALPTVARAARLSRAGRRTRMVCALSTSVSRSVPGVRRSNSLRFAVARPTGSLGSAVTRRARPVSPTRARQSLTTRG